MRTLCELHHAAVSRIPEEHLSLPLPRRDRPPEVKDPEFAQCQAALVDAMLSDHLLVPKLPQSVEKFAFRMGISVLLEFARSREVISAAEYQRLRDGVAVRNRLAHTRGEVSGQQARSLVRGADAAAAKVRQATTAPRPTN